MLNKEQKEEVGNALNSVWEAIGADALEMCENQTASKSEVIEMCLDADRVATMGNLEPDTLAAWQALSLSDKLTVANKAFTYASYGY